MLDAFRKEEGQKALDRNHREEVGNPGLVVVGRLEAGPVVKDRTGLVVAAEGGVSPIGRNRRKTEEGVRKEERALN